MFFTVKITKNDAVNAGLMLDKLAFIQYSGHQDKSTYLQVLGKRWTWSWAQ